MLQSLEEVRKVEMDITGVQNGVDNANLLSVDSITPITTGVDKVKSEEDIGGEAEAPKSEEKKDEKPTPPQKVEDKAKDPIQKRIDELTKKRRDAERQLSFKDSKIQELEEELKKVRSKVPVEGKPKRVDFEDDDAFMEALTDWKIDQKLMEKEEFSTNKGKETEEQKLVDEVESIILGTIEKGREKYEDFDQIVLEDKDLALTEAITEAVLAADVPEDVFYYLGKNPEVAANLVKLSSARIAIEIGKIEVKLAEPVVIKEGEVETTPTLSTVSAPERKLSKAPPPIVPPKGTGVSEKDPERMNPKEYKAWRERNK